MVVAASARDARIVFALPARVPALTAAAAVTALCFPTATRAVSNPFAPARIVRFNAAAAACPNSADSAARRCLSDMSASFGVNWPSTDCMPTKRPDAS